MDHSHDRNGSGMTHRFEEEDTPQFEVVGICHLCRHRTGLVKCTAFAPDPIPTEILVGDVVHTRPYPGDKGIVFEAIFS